MKKFDSDLAAIHNRMVEMAELAKTMVTLAAAAVKDRTRNVRDEIAAHETRLDQMQTEIDRDAVRMLTVYGPVATELRDILVTNHVTAQLERMGDQAVNICESLELMRTEPEQKVLPELRKMADLVCEMVGDALASYFDRDPVKAESTRTHDDLVDALNAQVIKKLLSDELLEQVLKGTREIADALAQILIARHLERIADQAVNICKQVIYLVSGDDVRHVQKD
jgi:phosphate transport system protein